MSRDHASRPSPIVAVDAMGGDFGPRVVVEGALRASKQLDARIILVGRRADLESFTLPEAVEVVDAPDVVEMGEQPTEAIKAKPGSSINVAINLVKEGRAQAFVSAGNTGACMAAAFLRLGRVRGIERPALATVFPMGEDRFLCLIDAGANADCRPRQIYQFAAMGSAFMERLFGIERPRVGLLNIGEEETKGSQLALESYALLKDSDLNFVGNVEGKDLMTGSVEVAATDGFTGNVTLKTAEGMAEFLFKQIREAANASLPNRLAALVLRPQLRRIRARLDYAEYGGANLLGVRGVVVIAHGRSDARAIFGAIRIAVNSVNVGLVDAMAGVGAQSARNGPSAEDEESLGAAVSEP